MSFCIGSCQLNFKQFFNTQDRVIILDTGNKLLVVSVHYKFEVIAGVILYTYANSAQGTWLPE